MYSTDIPFREEQSAKDGIPSGRITIDAWRQVIQCAVLVAPGDTLLDTVGEVVLAGTSRLTN
jgi:hypothetical protein